METALWIIGLGILSPSIGFLFAEFNWRVCYQKYSSRWLRSKWLRYALWPATGGEGGEYESPIRKMSEGGYKILMSFFWWAKIAGNTLAGICLGITLVIPISLTASGIFFIKCATYPVRKVTKLDTVGQFSVSTKIKKISEFII